MTKLPWTDLETTGLDPQNDVILEAAIVITDSKLFEIGHANIVIHQPEDVLARMCDYVREMHTKSGLLDEVQASQFTLDDLQTILCQLVDDQFGAQKPILCGSSIHFDRRFIARWLPILNQKLHYRMIDVSSTMETFRIMHGYQFEKPEPAHRAMSDIKNSIAFQRKLNESILAPGTAPEAHFRALMDASHATDCVCPLCMVGT